MWQNGWLLKCLSDKYDVSKEIMQTYEKEMTSSSKPDWEGLPPGLPRETEVQQVMYVTGEADAQGTLLSFKEPLACRAVVQRKLAGAELVSSSESLQELSLLLVPTTNQEDAKELAAAWDWLEPGISPESRQGLLITLQGTRVLWIAGRAAILSPANRLDTLRLAVVEFALHEGELRKAEQLLAKDWPQLEGDAPLAFDYDEKASLKRSELAKRFQQTVQLRSRLVRINPVMHRPPTHPPTLAGQLTERLKERARVIDRLDFVSSQLEVFEKVYEMCADRANEFSYSRKETTLEWVIILLLAAETIILLIDLMATLGK